MELNCPRCNGGGGFYLTDAEIAAENDNRSLRPCENCNGTGTYWIQTMEFRCPPCNGRGEVHQNDEEIAAENADDIAIRNMNQEPPLERRGPSGAPSPERPGNRIEGHGLLPNSMSHSTD